MKHAKNLTAALGLVGVIVATPLILWTVMGNPIPTHPSIKAITDAFASRDDGTILVHLITWLCWAAWAYFTVAVLVEAISQLRQARDQSALNVPGLGGARTLVAPLVSVALGLSIAVASTAAPAMADTPHPAPIAATATPTTQPATPATQAPQAATEQQTPTTAPDTRYTVQRDGEALWSIAEHFYGQGSAWTKIAKANVKVVGDDGRGLLRAGDVLTIPDVPSTTTAEPAGYTAHTVTATDTLRSLAETHLGSTDRWRDIYDASKSITQPDGQHLTDPDVIVDGWTLHIPTKTTTATASTTTTTPTTQKASTPSRAPHTGTTVPAGYTAHTVTATDTLRSLAETHLGSADRWRDIYDASKSITQPDGQHLTDPDVIVDGWTLHIPTKTNTATTTTASVAVPALPVPASSTATAAPSAQQTPTAPVEGPAAAPVTVPVAPVVVASHAPSVAPSTKPAAPAVSAPAVPAQVVAPRLVPVPAPAASSTPSMQTSQAPAAEPAAETVVTSSSTPRGVEAVGGVLAVCLLGILGSRWRRQAARRRPGQRIPAPAEEAAATITALQQSSGPLTTAHLDRALRVLSLVLNEQQRMLPPLLAVRLDDARIDFILAEDTPAPPAPFTATSQRVWTFLPPSSGMPDVTGVPAPYPALVTLGRDADDGHLLVDLETLGALAITDPHPEEIVGVLALELASSTWADDLTITMVGAYRDLPTDLGIDRLQYVETMDELITLLEGEAAQASQLLTSESLDSARDGRAGEGADAFTPHVVLVATDIDEVTAQRLGQILTDQPRVSIAAVTSGQRRLSAWSLITDQNTELATLDPLGLVITPQRLTVETYDAIRGVSLSSLSKVTEPAPWWDHSDTAARPDEGPEPADDDNHSLFMRPVADIDDTIHLPAIAEDLDESAAADEEDAGAVVPLHQPYIRLLGDLAIDNVAQDLQGGRGLAEVAEPVVFIHLHPGCLTTALNQALNAHTSRPTELVSRARKYMGTNADGEKLLPPFISTPKGRTYELHPSVTSDWAQLNALVSKVNTAHTPDLVRALDLVTGRPLASIAPGKWPWIEDTRTDMIAMLLDIAHEVADRSLAKGDTSRAAWAIKKGHLVDPSSELIDRDELRLHRLTGNHSAAQDVVDRVLANCAAIGLDPDEDTLELIHSTHDDSRRLAHA